MSKHKPLTEAIEIIEIKVKSISADDAVKKRDGDYRCPKCGQPLIPFKKSTKAKGAAAHFEHRLGSQCCPECPQVEIGIRRIFGLN